MIKNPASEYNSCKQLEALLDTWEVFGKERARVYKAFVSLVPAIRAKVIGESESVVGPINAGATLGEVAEKHDFTGSERTAFYTGIPKRMGEDSLVYGMVDTEQIIVDTSLFVSGGIKALMDAYHADRQIFPSEVVARANEVNERSGGENLDMGRKVTAALMAGKAETVSEAYALFDGFGVLKTYLKQKARSSSRKKGGD